MEANRNSIVFSWLLLLMLSHLCLWMNVQSTEMPSVQFKAVNLGGWLVTEGWITPSLFDNHARSAGKITACAVPWAFSHVQDGTQVQFMSTASGKYLTAQDGGGSQIVANRNDASGWETFKLWRVADDQFQFRVFNKQFIGLDGGGGPSSPFVAVATVPGESETFQIIRNPADRNRVHIKALSNGMFVQARSEGTVTADFSGEPDWGDSSNAVFVMKVFGGIQGEFQVTNGHGPERAGQVMQEHWNTFIVEDDFDFIAKNGLNSVRIPVGWWTAKDPTPAPFVAGSLDVLDRAFSWAEKYGLKVILDLHAPPYSQNGKDHSGSRDGTIEFGSTQETIDQTVEVIEFFSAKYASSQSLAAVELINEPSAPDVSLDVITRYYEAGYAAVRRHSPTAYVIMSKRLGVGAPPAELLTLANGRSRTVIDVHYYSIYSPIFHSMTVQQHINYIYQDRASQLSKITQDNGPLSFVGEWVAEWKVQGATKEEYQQFANAQLEVYGKASFGWAYWTLKAENATHWSLKWMIENGYISL
ncbi:putative glucan 1-3-beta-glucosidase A [Nymphaea thermarum]|nr:putative glucan 1-3-beta-glucosidase A [Nymphaea thermarum]